MAYFSTFETRDKLILLYFLHASGLKLTEADLLHAILDNEWMNYFDFARVLAELKEGGMVAAEKRSYGDLLTLTKKGGEVLGHFAERLPLSLRSAIDKYAESHRRKLSQSAQHIASYRKRGEGDYLVQMRIIDQNAAILSLELSVPTEAMAKTFVHRWQDRAPDLFAYAIHCLGDAEA